MEPTGLTAQAVADLIGGRLLGDGAVVLRAVSPLERAGPDSLSLAVSSHYTEALKASRAGAVLIPEMLTHVPAGPRTRIVVADPHVSIASVLEAMFPPSPVSPGIHPTARLGSGCRLGQDVSIGPFVVLGRGVQVGDRCRLAERVSLGDGVIVGPDTIMGPGVTCYSDSRIGSRCVLKAGAVIGGDGFGYLSGPGGHRRIRHVGGCILEDDVEVGSNTCVDRGSIDDTILGRGTKLDNLVHVAHNVQLGERCLAMAGVGIAGSTRIGNDVILAGHVGVTDHLVLGSGVRVGAKSAVFGDIPSGATFSGHPARPHRQFLRAQAALYRLAPIIDEIEQLVSKRSHDA